MCARRPAKVHPSTWSSQRSGKRFMSKGSILVVDDESEIREGLELLLRSEGYGVSSAETGQSGLEKLEQHPYDLLLLDVSLPDRNGLDMLKEIHRRDPQLSIVLITAYGSIDMARAAFKNGAMDYIAKAIHSASTRADKAFVPVNTGSIPVDLLESQLFGHVKGAFTSAVASKKGLFEVADQGTIFFDEISTIGPETQAKLLRVIQEREFMRLGGTETIKVDVRIIAACNVQLLSLVREGRFREDLYHRLNVIAIPLPSLRERREDVPRLLDHFLRKFSEENGRPMTRFTPAALKLLVDYNWPGNVRELENVVERAVVLSSKELMDVDLLPESVRSKEIVGGVRLQLSEFIPLGVNARGEPPLPGEPGARTGADRSSPSLFQIMDEIERRVICDMLERTGWNQTEAAERFQVPLSTLNQKIKRLGIDARRRGSGRTGGDEPVVSAAGK